MLIIVSVLLALVTISVDVVFWLDRSGAHNTHLSMQYTPFWQMSMPYQDLGKSDMALSGKITPKMASDYLVCSLPQRKKVQLIIKNA